MFDESLHWEMAATPERIVTLWEAAMLAEDYDLACEIAYFMKRVELGLEQYDVIH